MMFRRLSLSFVLPLAFTSMTACNRGGDSDVAPNLNPHIINGSAVDPNSSPQIVRLDLVFLSETGQELGGICTGTVISSDEVLTAGHCVFGNGTVLRGDVIAANGVFPITDAWVHPNFGVDQSGFLVNDVAIFRTKVPMGLPTLPIVLSKPAEEGETIGIFGYGLDENGDVGSLKGGTMTLSSATNDVLFAVFDNASDTCFGDSGGPATLTLDDGSVGIVGVTSGGSSTDCSLGETSSFTNLQSPSVISFIQSVVPEVAFN